MNRHWLRFAEVMVLLLIGGGILYVMMHKDGEAFYAAAFLALGSVIAAIRNQAQAHVMNALADHLARSTPVKGDE